MRAELSELNERWSRARRSALRSVLSGATATADEPALVARGMALDAPRLLRAVHENSRVLGAGFATFHGRELTLSELPEAFAALQAPCTHGNWTRLEEGAGIRVERTGCGVSRAERFSCEYWREAIDGLVLGLTGRARHARHRSAGAGDSSCVDVIYLDPRSRSRFGPIPPELAEELERVRRLVRSIHSGIDLVFLGLSEGVLHYEERRSPDARSLGVATLIRRSLARRFPDLALREVSPRPVLADPTFAAGELS